MREQASMQTGKQKSEGCSGKEPVATQQHFEMSRCGREETRSLNCFFLTGQVCSGDAQLGAACLALRAKGEWLRQCPSSEGGRDTWNRVLLVENYLRHLPPFDSLLA